MKICLYSPYVPGHFGGGERYFFDVARTLRISHEVTIAVPSETVSQADTTWHEASEVRQEYEAFLGSSLEGISWRLAPLSAGHSWWQRWNWTRQFDCMYYVTDGSFFVSGAKRNVVHIQIPFTQPLSLPQRLKLLSWQIINTNSAFTKKVIEKHWGVVPGFVHYPMIDVGVNQSPPMEPKAGLMNRKKVILSVGRFFRQLHHKRHDVLIDTFALLRQRQPELLKGWSLQLVGGVEDKEYVEELHQQARGLPVTFHHDVPREQLLKWYQQAAVYWHAAGHGVDEVVHPESVEHFGISTAEAMASGAVPVVIGKGGQKEVMGQELKHLLWHSPEECVEITAKLLRQPAYYADCQRLALTQAKQFSPERFAVTLQEMVE